MHVHGNTFIPQALERGAAAIIYQDQLPDNVQEAISQRRQQGLMVPPLVQVPDSRFAMSPIADCFYDSPSSKLVVIGVTGTEGKS
ncbi:MAG: UDP-N-acetylmuramyl peptide synthase, partial [Spirochaetaceae bacterium]|nr:UDP-N-acetylmuramyl peptide synthase [Spirochaetaceae bacterium]